MYKQRIIQAWRLNMTHNNDSVRNKLIEITNQGLMLKAIALNAGLDVDDQSKFKGGMECLKKSELKILSEYLNAVVIPQKQNISFEKKKSTKLDILRMRMKKENLYQ